MDHQEIQAALLKVFRECFADDTIVLRDDTDAAQIPDWDSLNHIRLMASVEKQFGIRFSLRELSSLKNVGQLTDLVKQKILSRPLGSF